LLPFDIALAIEHFRHFAAANVKVRAHRVWRTYRRLSHDVADRFRHLALEFRWYSKALQTRMESKKTLLKDWQVQLNFARESFN
jgi:hypothetical protein